MPPKTQTVGIICLNERLLEIIQGFKQHLTQLGHIENKNIRYLYECPLRDDSATQSALDRLISQPVDLLFTMSTPITKMALNAVKDNGIPIVFTPVYNVVESGLVSDLVNHHQNLTGVQVGGSTPKTLEWLLTTAPATRHLLVPINTSDPAANFGLRDLQEVADKLSIQLVIADISSVDELTAVLQQPPQPVDAIWLLNGNYLVPRIQLFVDAAIRLKVPLVSPTAQYKEGVMLSYGQRYELTGQQMARLAHKILQGTSPQELPIETADFFLGINLQTANAADITIPDEILRQAKEIIR